MLVIAITAVGSCGLLTVAMLYSVMLLETLSVATLGISGVSGKDVAVVMVFRFV